MQEGLHILIADDSELMRVVMKGYFKKLLTSPQIVEVSNLIDAFDFLNAQRFDFLLLDINMPRGDSNPDTVRQVLSIQQDIKVCMFTGNDKASLQEAYHEAGAIGFIQKDEDMGLSIKEILERCFS
ncbi:response regulator [Pedobacter sandarakinus]|uniref:response regulator n=1 Tax=Pedobacter sandarakinus TaxID=353156 RepID=UPI0022455FD2|nr:response regulator [Pedobacter sandarakinus]MCX2574385.1 response regulator [Pedobacter sandarakinus]